MPAQRIATPFGFEQAGTEPDDHNPPDFPRSSPADPVTGEQGAATTERVTVAV